MRLRKIVTIALLSVVLVSIVACSTPPPYTHVSLHVPKGTIVNTDVYLNEGDVLEGYYDIADVDYGFETTEKHIFSCCKFDFYINGVSDINPYSLFICFGLCEQGYDFSARCRYPGPHTINFYINNGTCSGCPQSVEIDLYYRIR